MKAALILAALVISSQAFAVPRLDARKSTCLELQEALQDHGTISVRSRNFIIARTTRVTDDPRCGVLAYAKPAIFRTLDVLSCEVGYTCEEDRSLRGDCYPGNNPSSCR